MKRRKRNTMSKAYRRLQVVKHALQYYLKREEPEEDKVQERELLKKVEDQIEFFKDKNKIK